MNPPWLKGGDGYIATVLRFIDNKMQQRKGDERLSVVIEFEKELEFKGLKGKYAVIDTRWQGQTWKDEGVVHVCLLSKEITSILEKTEDNSRWVESHAEYKKID